MIFEPRTAASIGLPYLYHYQRFNLEGVRSVIVDKKLYLSRPSAFNDPWDCKPCFDIDLSDDESVEAHAAYFERCDRKLNSHLGEAELAVRAARDWPDLLRAGPDGFLQFIAELRGAGSLFRYSQCRSHTMVQGGPRWL